MSKNNKFRTIKWIEVNDESRRMYKANSQIKCETSVLSSSLCDYSYAYVLVCASITVPKKAAADASK